MSRRDLTRNTTVTCLIHRPAGRLAIFYWSLQLWLLSDAVDVLDSSHSSLFQLDFEIQFFRSCSAPIPRQWFPTAQLCQMDGMLLKPRVVTTQMVPTPVLQADAGAGRGHHGHHGHHWEGVMVGLVTSSMGSIAQRCQRPKSNRLKAATKAVKTKITMCAEGEADPLLAEAKAAAEAAKLQLEAVAWLKMNDETWNDVTCWRCNSHTTLSHTFFFLPCGFLSGTMAEPI